MSIFSQRLREARKETGLSQAAFGEFLGLKATAYPNYEKYDSYPCMEDLKKIAVGLDLPLDYLLGRSDEKKSLSGQFDIENTTPFPVKVRQLRKQHGMTQLGVSEALGLLSKFSYIAYERGDKEPLGTRLIALAALFGVSVDELVGFRKKDGRGAG